MTVTHPLDASEASSGRDMKFIFDADDLSASLDWQPEFSKFKLRMVGLNVFHRPIDADLKM